MKTVRNEDGTFSITDLNWEELKVIRNSIDYVDVHHSDSEPREVKIRDELFWSLDSVILETPHRLRNIGVDDETP